MNQGRFEQDNRRGGRRDSQDFENDEMRPWFGEDPRGSRQGSDQDERYRSDSYRSGSGYGQSSRGGYGGERGTPRGRDFDGDRSGRSSTELADYSGSQAYREGRGSQFGSQYGRGFQESGRELGSFGAGGRQGNGSGAGGYGSSGSQNARRTDGSGSSSWGSSSEWDSGSGATEQWGRSGNLLGRQGQQSFQGRGPKGYQRSDDRIREDISDRLTDDGSIDASEIMVQVQTGEVTLTGTVDSREQKRCAEDLVEQVTGVKEVINNLRISRHGGDEQQSSSGEGRGDKKDPSKTAGKTGAVS